MDASTWAAALKLIGGAAAGALLGLLLSSARVCSATACRARPNRILSILAGAVFGAAIVWYLMHTS